MSKYVEVEIDRYEDLIVREERFGILLDTIYNSTRYAPYEEDLRIAKGDDILKCLYVIDGQYYGKNLRIKEEEYKRRQDEEYNKQVNQESEGDK